MSRLLFLFAIAAVVWLLIKAYRKNTDKSASTSAPAATEDMVRCAHCGVHLPQGESVQQDEKFFCSNAHRDAFHS